MGKFLNEILEISADFHYAKRAVAMNIIEELNEYIRVCAKEGYTEMSIHYRENNVVTPMISASNLKNSFIMDYKYKKDRDIFNCIINYYKDEEFFISGEFDMISWNSQLEKYLNSKRED